MTDPRQVGNRKGNWSQVITNMCSALITKG